MELISLLVFIGFFTAGCIKLKGLPECISDLYYIFGRWFTFCMILASGLMLPVMLDATPENYQSLAFLCCAGLMFVGAAGNYRDKFEYPIHYTAACLSAVTSISWVGVINPWYIFTISLSLIGLIDRKRWLLWCELPCFMMIYLIMASL